MREDWRVPVLFRGVLLHRETGRFHLNVLAVPPLVVRILTEAFSPLVFIVVQAVRNASEVFRVVLTHGVVRLQVRLEKVRVAYTVGVNVHVFVDRVFAVVVLSLYHAVVGRDEEAPIRTVLALLASREKVVDVSLSVLREDEVEQGLVSAVEARFFKKGLYLATGATETEEAVLLG